MSIKSLNSTYALAFLAVFLGSDGGAVSGSVGAAPLFPPRAGFFSGVDFWTPLERFLGDSSLSSLAPPAGNGDRFLLGGESGFLGAAAAAAFPPRPLLGAGASGASTDAGCSSSALAEAAALAAAAPLPLLAGAATSASAATGDLAAIGQVWSLTQFYSVDFSQSKIGVNKCVFNKRTIKVRVSSVVVNGVLGPPHLARHTS